MFFLWLCCAAFPGPAHAEDVNLQASVDRTQVAVGQTLTLTVSISANGSVPAPAVKAPSGFNIVGSTSSSSTSISIVNGAMTSKQTISYIYTLQARQVGSFVIPPAQVTYKGKTYTSSPIRVQVVKGTGKRQTRPTPTPGQSISPQDLEQLEKNLFILAKPDRKQAYVGQQVEVTYTLYTRYNLQNVRYGHLPTFTGFWAETLFDARRLDLHRTVVDGRAFNAAVLKRVALFPTSAGEHKLEQLEVICDVPVRSQQQNPFDLNGFFNFDPFGQTRQVTVRSADLEIDALPLPAGAPSGFGGAVGQYRISAQAIPTTVQAGDPISLKVVVSGTGNLSSVPEPVRPRKTGMQFYDPQISLKKQNQGDLVGGRKTFDYVVIPQHAGKQEIPSFRLPYFDPEKKAYASVQTEPISLVVQPGAPVAQAPPPSGPSQSEVRVVGKDIRYIKPDVSRLENQAGVLYQNWVFLALQTLPVLGFFGAFAYRRHRDRLAGDVAYARRKRARSEARRRLTEARRLMGANERGPFYDEINRALAQFLADRLNLPVAGMTGESAARALATRKVPQDVVSRVQAMFEKCDFARFAPAQVKDEDMGQVYERAEALIGELGGKV